MKQVKAIGGQEFKDMFSAATNWLEKSSEDINSLNVYPVPDGDTGTNMLLTMRSGMEETLQADGADISQAAQAMAKGTLMGARGNSGVILSQVFNGIAQALEGKKTADSKLIAQALTDASDKAYKGLSNPVEGTILTVAREAAVAAQKQADNDESDTIAVMEAAVNAASEAVANTPNLLQVLRDAGVVDAGGQGLFTIYEGILFYLKDEVELMQFRKSRVIASSAPLTTRQVSLSAKDEEIYGYCTEFLIKGEELEPDKIKSKLKRRGKCLMVVGDNTTVRVHIHALNPGNIIHYAASLGTLHTVSLRNMDEQHEDFRALQKERVPTIDIAVVAIAAGDGLADVLTSLGASAIVPGGQTMNPSTKDIFQAAERVPSDKIIILPNNKNIIASAEQVASLTDKKIAVIPTRTIPQGVSALLAFDYEADFETNTNPMKEAISAIKTIEITRANRSTRIDGLAITKKQAIGLFDGKLLAVSDKPIDVLIELFDMLDLNQTEVATIYYGVDTGEEEAEEVSASIRKKYPEIQVEVVSGGQPHYNYIVSIE